ncbi:MAG: integration host factor subunit alpha [Burkholderiales bacterium]|jgi:integration host factor subunit alpha|nr:integration host factor subunit alpha [Burkholderiales bacterium]
MTVTKSELVNMVMHGSSLKRNEADRFVDDFFDVISKALAEGETVKMPGFGNFVLRDKGERSGRNPKTGAPFPIEARRVVSFRTSNMLKLAIKDKCEKDKKVK